MALIAPSTTGNISDVNATDLTDGGETTLHIHDGRYYTESETNALINNAFANPTFTGLLTTPTLRLNGTAVLVNNSAPTVRSDGSALVDGDIWYNPSTGIFGTRRSLLWLGPVRYSSQENKSISSQNPDRLFGFDKPSIVGTNNGNTALFIESCLFSQMPGSTTPFGDSSNYTLYRFGYSSSTTSYADLYTVQSNLLPSSIGGNLQYSYPINAVYNIMQFNCGFTTVGSPNSQSQSSIRLYYKYREVL